ncbi:UDP-N-acetylmuramoyl-L-alanine--D-glutamate ligase [Actinomyces bowdenii]|uniref:UDP-N-acetylmuramoylalanine--D-glutamate ligase n=1 Tax=Actinomyces bowdenii TaxID=131109 RepID=A0A3P1V5N9_9ACTO|nr:UDP-N-acetylmuramoyl-L-alanine--D-glutamate ligase [Actinomyces bowdenii]RRD29449.1 UDP-N-acetylmuramoyl-L-alanine--D-glutamate ligase [Actinomyces bowdenii]
MGPAAPARPGLADRLRGARVGVVGLGRTGRAVIEALRTLGAQVHAFDTRAASLDELALPVAGAAAGSAEEIAGAVEEADLGLLIVSPGVPATGPVLTRAAGLGLETWSEVELAWRLQGDSSSHQVPWLTLTGTDGKTTTVTMLSQILQAAGLRAPAVGNIGTPVIEAVLAGGAQALAVELSSFQLHTTRSLSPLASACLNLAADHLDWHGGMEAYAADKARIYRGTRRAAVYSTADAATERMVRDADVVEGCRAVGFTLGAPGLGQVGMVEDLLVDRAFHDRRADHGVELATTADLAHLAPGGRAEGLPAHLVADALAAAALARAAGAPAQAVAEGLRAFTPGAHRSATAAQGGGVTWVNDSKATNPHAAQAALSALPEGRGVWIVGGDTKGASLHELVVAVRSRLHGAVVIGKDQSGVLEALGAGAPGLPVTTIADAAPRALMEAAVRAAADMARPGDTVLLAPACASWDQFSSYAQRGDLFAEAARAAAQRADAAGAGAGRAAPQAPEAGGGQQA